jgi:hypothetical protein
LRDWQGEAWLQLFASDPLGERKKVGGGGGGKRRGGGGGGVGGGGGGGGGGGPGDGGVNALAQRAAETLNRAGFEAFPARSSATTRRLCLVPQRRAR